MLYQCMGNPGYGRASDPDSQVCEAHGLAARLVEPARQQNVVRQWPSAHVAESVEEVKQIKHAQSRNPTQSHQRSTSHQDTSHHDAARTKAIDDPARDKSKDRSHNQLAQRISQGDLGARPLELLHHEVVIEREPHNKTHNAEQDDKSSLGNLDNARPEFRLPVRTSRTSIRLNALPLVQQLFWLVHHAPRGLPAYPTQYFQRQNL